MQVQGLRLKSCQCLNPLHRDDDHKKCVAGYVLFFEKLDKGRRSMIIIEILKVLFDVQNRNNPKPFMLRFVASDDGWINELLQNVFICKKALGALFGIGREKMRVLVQHAVNHTLLIHGLTRRVPEFNTKFQQNVVPPLAYFFKNHILSMAGVQPTQYTCWAVTQTVTERDTNHIQELDPIVSKRGLFKEYAYVHSYKIKTTTKGSIIKIPDNNNKYNQIEICSWG